MPSSTSTAPKKLTRAIISVGTVWGPSPAHTHQTVEARPDNSVTAATAWARPVAARQVGDDLGVVDVDADDTKTAALESLADRSADPRADPVTAMVRRVAGGVGHLGPSAAVHGGTL